MKRKSAQKRSQQSQKNPLGYVPTRQSIDHWNLIKKDVYVAPPQRQIPAWLLPLAAFLLIVVIVFYVAPTMIERLSAVVNPTVPSGQAVIDQLYGEETAVVQVPVADLLVLDDIKAERIAQVLYNEPVTKLSKTATLGFTAVRLSDGTEGFMFSDQLSDRRDSIEPAGHQYRLIISAATRRIMTHASKGTLVAEVMMGTTLFSDYRGDGIYRVHLPDGKWGWISDEGTIALGIHDQVEPPKDLARYFVSSAMAFHRVTRLQNGLSVLGASSDGIAFVAAMINGVSLPRTMAGQYTVGIAVSTGLDPATGLAVLDQLKTGDLVFFAAGAGQKEPDEMGIVMTDGQILMSRRGWTSIRLVNLAQNPELHRLFLGARRVIVEPG